MAAQIVSGQHLAVRVSLEAAIAVMHPGSHTSFRFTRISRPTRYLYAFRHCDG